MNKMLAILCSLIATVSAQVTTTISPNKWVGLEFGTESGTVTLTNKTTTQRQIDGVRVSVPNAALGQIKSQGSWDIGFAVNDGSASNRFDMLIGNRSGGVANDNLPLNILNPNKVQQYGIYTEAVAKDANWTPKDPQILIIGGKSLAEKRVNKDISGITLKQLDSIMKTPEYYDSKKYVPDTLGIHGGAWGAGFVDCWYDQTKNAPIWQIQVGLPPLVDSTGGIRDTFRIWGEPKKFEPDSMDNRDGAYGRGPRFMMGAAMAQELMNIDMQYLLATGFQESNAGLVKYKTSWVEGYMKDDKWVNGYNTLVSDGVNYYNHGRNEDQTRGPLHYIESSYKTYVYEGYPKFFPFETSYQPSPKFVTTPATGGCELNSPQIGNAYLVSSLYMWYSWQLVVAKLGQKGLDFFKTAPNREIAAQMISWAWNKGFNGEFATYVLSPDGSRQIDKSVDYVGFVWKGVNALERANRNSVLNGGTCPVYDAPITRKDVELFFFGEGGVGSTGTLGTAGILHHFNLTSEVRKTVWRELDSAVTMLKGKAPSTKGTEAISFRYDYLALLRVAKKFLDLTIPVPKVEEFKNWTTETSTVIVDRIAPFCPPSVQKKGTSAGNRFVKEWIVGDSANIPDSAGVRSVEWTIDPQWKTWNSVDAVTSSNFKLDMDQADLNALIPAGPDTVTAWVQVTDRNENSLIDTFSVWRVAISVDTTKKWIAPTADSSRAIDTDGDGNANAIELFFTAEPGYDLKKISGISYVWPAGSSAVAASTSSSTSSKITITPVGLTGGSGTGTLQFSFPEKKDYSVNIVDRVGAVIRSAVRLKRSDDLAKDTLVLTISEPLKSSTAAVSLFRLRSGESTISAESVTFSGSSAKLIFPRNSFIANDSVRFDPAGSLEDILGNKAHSANPATLVMLETDLVTAVPLNIIGGMYDSNGDGLADSAVISMNLSSATKRFTAKDFKNIQISWPKGVALAKTTVKIINDSTIAVTGFSSAVCSGEGELLGIFDDSLTVIRPIEDRVGPIITKAVRQKWSDSSAKDTLVLTLSESVKTVAGVETIALVRAVAAIPTVESITIAGSVATVVMARGTVRDGDSVRIVSHGTMVDLVGNRAHVTNRAVEILVIGEKRPAATAAYFDRTGDGLPDSIRIDLKLGSDKNRFTANDLTNLTATLSEGTVLTGFTVNKTNDSTVVITGFSGSRGFGAGTIGYDLPDGFRETVELRDSCGPALVHVIRYESNGSGNDTALIRFSEPMDLGSLAIQNYLETNKGKTMTCRTYEKSDRTNFMIIGDLTDLIVGDSVRIRSDKSVKESAGNGVHRNNQFREVRQLLRPLKLKSEQCWLFDRTADGTPDQIALTFEKPVDSSRLADMKFGFTWIGKGGTDIPTEFTGGSMAIVDSNRVTITFDETARLARGITDIRSGKSYLFQWDSIAGTTDTISVTLGDSMAPVILEARYFGMNITDSESDAIDTVQLSFSEPVFLDKDNWNRPFTCYSSSADRTFSMDLMAQSEGKTVKFAVRTDESSVIPRVGDSIWIADNRLVADQGGIVQENSTNRGALFTECRYSTSYAVELFPSVFEARSGENPLATRYGSTATLTENVLAIAVRPRGNRPGGTISGTVSLFDVLGNNVVAATEMAYNETNGALLFSAEMRNQSGRALGSGSYLAIIEVKDENGTTVAYRKVVGIRD